MDELSQTSVVTPEEQNAEKEFTKEVTDEVLREKVIADFGLDPENNKDLIEKLVSDKKANHAKLSEAIKQKINWRDKATSKPSTDKGGDGKVDITAAVNAALEERDLATLDIPEEVKTEVKEFAKFKNISVRDAIKLPYIQSKISEVKKGESVVNANPVRINNGGKTITIDSSKPLNPADFNLDTAEGQKAWKEAKEERNKYRQNH